METRDPFIAGIVRDWLINEMSEISEECYFAVWMCGLEDSLWNAVLNLPNDFDYGQDTISAERITRIRDASEWLGEWIIYKGRHGRTPVPLDEWKRGEWSENG
jgi:hypothetical protein